MGKGNIKEKNVILAALKRVKNLAGEKEKNFSNKLAINYMSNE